MFRVCPKTKKGFSQKDRNKSCSISKELCARFEGGLLRFVAVWWWLIKHIYYFNTISLPLAQSHHCPVPVIKSLESNKNITIQNKSQHDRFAIYGIPLLLPVYCAMDALQWRHNGRDGVSNHQLHHCLLNCLFGRRSKKISKLRITGLCAGNSPGPGNSPHKCTITRKWFHLMTSPCCI